MSQPLLKGCFGTLKLGNEVWWPVLYDKKETKLYINVILAPSPPKVVYDKKETKLYINVILAPSLYVI